MSSSNSNKLQKLDTSSDKKSGEVIDGNGSTKSDIINTSLNLKSLEGFALQKVLLITAETINLLGTFPSADEKDKSVGQNGGQDEIAVILLRRKKLAENDVGVLCSKANVLALDAQNTYYGFYKSQVSSLPHTFDVTIIHPAKQWHIEKYSKQEGILLRETPELFSKITQPYIHSHPASEIKWLYQILQKEKEQERLLFEDSDPDNGFMFTAFQPAEECVAQAKANPDNFYALVLVNKRDLPSIRSLSTVHLPLLRNIRIKVLDYTQRTLGISSHHLRLFFHYKPTYFHLHVHVVHMNHEMHVHEKDYRLDDVIQNIEFLPQYYQRATLTYHLGTNDELYRHYLALKHENN